MIDSSPRFRKPATAPPCRRRAFIQVEIIFGIVVVGALLTMLTISAAKQDQALRQFADTRAALRHAEVVLTTLQAQSTPDTQGCATRVLADASPIPDHTWIQITARVHDRQASLTGLIPTAAVPKEAIHVNP